MADRDSSAFGQISTYLDPSTDRLVPVISSHGGLTKREYLAAMVMQGMLAARYHDQCGSAELTEIVQDAVHTTDFLIDAL